MKSRILVIGSSNIDFVCRMPRFPEIGECLVSKDTYAFVPGGKGANSALAAARLGGDVVFCSRVGNDSYGNQLVDKYEKEGIDTRFVVKDKTARTGLVVMMAEETGHKRVVAYPGANSNLCLNDLEGAFTTYPDALLMQLEIGAPLVIAATEMAQEKGIKVILDAGLAKADFPLESLGKLEIFSPNETETQILTGIYPNSSDNCLRACVNLMNRVNTNYIVLKLGERGCYIYDGIHCTHVAPVEAGTVVDTTAAGDSFTAALTYRYCENGGDIQDACKFANAVGAYVVTKQGAFSSIPTMKELQEFLANK